LSADPGRRGARLAAAAGCAADAGQRGWAAALVRRAAADLRDPVSRARLALVDAALADAEGRHEAAAELLHDPAVAVAGTDPGLAADLLTWIVEAGWAARDAGVVRRAVDTVHRLGLPDAGHVLELAEVVGGQLDEDLPPVPGPVRAISRLCGVEEAARSMTKGARWGLLLGDHDAAHELATTAERISRARGQLGVLPDALAVLADTRWHLGRPRDARAAAEEGLRIARDVGQERSVHALADVLAGLAAVAGDEVGLEAALAEAGAHHRTVLPAAARSLLDLGAGRFDAAADRLAALAAGPSAPEVRSALPDLVEAAVRAGRPEVARAAADRFARWAEQLDRVWAQAVALRCRALVTDGPAAGALFAEAVARHRSDARPGGGPGARGGSRPFERARTELLHGGVAAPRPAAGRGPRSAALGLRDLRRLGAAPWAARARAELRATGESRTDPPPDGPVALTPQELQVVRLAAEG
jgi:hypothetical protein